MIRSLAWYVSFALCLVLSLASAARAATPLKAGDRVVFYGDSITQQRLYTRYLQQYIHCRYPGLDVRFFNAGWSGDRAPGGVNRLERDVLSLRPTVVTLFFGMNDGGYKKLEEATVTTYRNAMEKLITRLKDEGVRVIVYGPGCVDDDRRPALHNADYNATLAALSAAAGELAAKYGCEYVDVHAAMLAFQQAQKAADPEFTMIPDAVHPNAKGQLVMARAMLEPFAEPMPTIEAPAAAVSEGIEGGKVHGTRFTATLGAPFWIEPGSQAVAEASGIVAFAAPKLIAGGLPEGAYQISVDGLPAAEASAAELAAGVPLSANSPRGKRLHDLIATKEDLYFTAWRDIRLDLKEVQSSAAAADALLAADEALQTLIRDYAGPAEVVIAIDPKPEGPNLALKKPYETDAPNRYNWGIGGLTDGSWDATSRTCFASDDSHRFPKSVTIDLEQAAPLTHVILGVPPFGSTKTIAVSLSADGAAFTEVGRYAFSLRKQERHTFSFPAQAARYVRLTYPDHHTEQAQYNPRFVFTTEVEVYGQPAE